MSTSLLLFLGIQCLSIAVMCLFLFEHRRLCIAREQFFRDLGDTGQAKRRLVRLLLIGFYVLTTMFILVLSAHIFFLLP